LSCFERQNGATQRDDDAGDDKMQGPVVWLGDLRKMKRFPNTGVDDLS
jgi:hypothetical protein